MESSKMEWMYKNSSETLEREEYLLGRAIDKNFEAQLSGSFNEVDKDITPASIFSNSNSNLQVDVIRKLKEDPLEQIRQKEIETRKQLLKNPVKLKKLQNMLKANRDKQEKLLKKHAKKKKKKSNEIDQLLTSKFLKLKEKLGNKNLIDIDKIESVDDLSNRKVKSSKKGKSKKRSTPSSSDSSSSSDISDSDSNSDSSDSNSSSSNTYRKYHIKGRTNKRKASEERKQSSPYRDGSSNKNYGLDLMGSKRKSNSKTYTSSASSSIKRYPPEKKTSLVQRSGVSKKLTDDEKARKLKEMTENATWRKQFNSKSVKRYKDEDKKEKEANQRDYDEGFLRRQMAIATSQATVQDRIKSKVNYLQRSERHMSENFARR